VTKPFARRALLALVTASLAGGLVACDGRPKTQGAIQARESKLRTGPALAVIDLTAGAPEQDEGGLLQAERSHRTLDALLTSAARAATDGDTKGVFVRFGSTQLALARAEEIGAALAEVKKTKPVVCHAEGLSNASYAVAARGCSKIWVSPAGGVDTVGIAAQLLYARRLLEDNLHLSVDVLQVGKYKGAEEPFTRDGPSDEARASLESTLASLRVAWLDTMRARGGDHPDKLLAAAEDGPYSADGAQKAGLTDATGYADEAFASLGELAQAAGARQKVIFGPSEHGDDDELAGVLKTLVGTSAGSAPVALLRATGSIDMGEGGGLGSSGDGIHEAAFDRMVRRLEKDDDVKAVVLRIDSPGGSALASDLMWHHLMRLRSKKPLVVSVGEMAASGGYYLACTGSYIYADAGSIVGSIGVVGGKVAVAGLLEQVGVHSETFAAKPGPEARARAAYESPLAPWDDATRARVLESMKAIYSLFLARVSEGRSTEGRTIPIDKVGASAEGRIFGGREGQARGLVDEIGGLELALARARSLAHLPGDARVQVVRSSRSLLHQLSLDDDDDGKDDPTDSAQSVDPLVTARTAAAGISGFPVTPEAWSKAADALAPGFAPFATSLWSFTRGERALAALPYGLIVR
jgi:protease-4